MNNRQAAAHRESIARETKSTSEWYRRNPHMRPEVVPSGDASTMDRVFPGPSQTKTYTMFRPSPNAGPLHYSPQPNYPSYPPMPVQYQPAPMPAATYKYFADPQAAYQTSNVAWGSPRARSASPRSNSNLRATTAPRVKTPLSRPGSRARSRSMYATQAVPIRRVERKPTPEPVLMAEPEWPVDEEGNQVKARWWYKKELNHSKNNLEIPDDVALYFGIAPTRSKVYCDDYFNTGKIAGYLPGRVDHAYIRRKRLDALSDKERVKVEQELGLSANPNGF